MGDYSKAVFGRATLPKMAIIRAGAHFPERAQRTLDQFDEVGEMHGKWTPYCYAKNHDQEYLIVFNVYGAASTLEVLRLLEEGGVEKIGFVGSAFAKGEAVGQQLLITSTYDQAGIVQLDGTEHVRRPEEVIEQERQHLLANQVDFAEVTLASVPCVMHGIESVHEFVRSDGVDGVEMELSTFFHFASKGGIQTYASVYVSDNPQNPILGTDKQKLRNDAMIQSTRLIRDILHNSERPLDKTR